MEEQKENLREKRYGGTMRLGSYACLLKENTKVKRAYVAGGERRALIHERHRHRYELNNKYRELLEKKGMIIAGIHPVADLAEIIELENHPFFVGTQFHPEFKSRPLRPHPLFRGFIKACIKSG
jgi:CTP synthase